MLRVTVAPTYYIYRSMDDCRLVHCLNNIVIMYQLWILNNDAV